MHTRTCPEGVSCVYSLFRRARTVWAFVAGPFSTIHVSNPVPRLALSIYTRLVFGSRLPTGSPFIHTPTGSPFYTDWLLDSRFPTLVPAAATGTGAFHSYSCTDPCCLFLPHIPRFLGSSSSSIPRLANSARFEFSLFDLTRLPIRRRLDLYPLTSTFTFTRPTSPRRVGVPLFDSYQYPHHPRLDSFLVYYFFLSFIGLHAHSHLRTAYAPTYICARTSHTSPPHSPIARLL
ncbi:hypothetical protein C8R43DRAFT_343199 [Mycena crocata]|nr:hypothetical protein C8R43DRAFT_343199 [Mycena crocata]